MKLAFILLAFLAALVAVHGAATTTVVGATGTTTAVGTTVPAVVKAGIPISVGNLSTVSSTSTTTVQGVTAGVTVSGTGATGSFVGQPTIVGSTGATVSVATAVATPAASAAASSAAITSASPAASGAAVVTIVSASPTAITSASPAASGAAVVTIVSASPAASGAAITSASPAASGAAVVTVVSPSPSISSAASPAASGVASPSASLAASPTASAAASRAASPTASLAASPGASASAAPLASASPAALVSAANLFPPMPTYGEENFQFTCPNATTQGMVEVSLEPLLIGISDVSSIKFAGCPSLMYVSTRAGQIFEVTINNQTSAVEQVRLILDLSSQIPTSSAQGTAGSSAASASASASASSSSASSSSSADQPGLLGMAFPPNFADTGLFYVYFSARSSGGAASATTTTGGASASIAGGATTASSSSSICGNESTMLDHVNRLAEYRLNSSSGIATFSRTLLELRWPFANDNGDNSLEFAPETMLLFLGVGDGGSSFDPFENAQNPDIMLGKVQVIDLNALPANASCNATVLRLSELERECQEVASAITTFATGMHAPAGFEFLSPSAELEAAACPSGANATLNATATAGGANATAAGGANATSANATAAGGANATSANATTSVGGRNLTLSELAPRLIAPDRGQGMYDEINIMEQIGANYGWDIIEGWTCVNQSLELCPESTSGRANVSAAGGANATSATASTNATTAAGANATAAGGANATAANATSGIAVLPAAVLPHNCRHLYNPQAVLGGRLYRGTQLDPLLQGAYVFGATTSLQNGNESLPTGNGALYFLRPESFSGNAEVDLTMCPSAANATASTNATTTGGANASSNATQSAGGANATATASNATSSANASLSGVTVTGSGVNTSFIPNSRLEVFPVTVNYQFFPTQHFFTAMGADASRTQLFLGVSSAQGGSGSNNIGGVFRLIPFNEGAQNPAVISATNLRPGQIVFSANATANATASASPSVSA